MESPHNVTKALTKLVPGSLINEISSFVFYDRHPLASKSIDLTILTNDGDIMEIKDRQITESISISKSTTMFESILKLYRNSRAELFYLVQVANILFIISSSHKLQIKKKLENVESFAVVDKQCKGNSRLQVLYQDDAVPVMFDDDLEVMTDRAIICGSPAQESSALCDQLQRKLVAAKYSVACNENKLQEYKTLRHETVFKLFQAVHPNLSKTFNEDVAKMSEALRIRTESPWIKIHNNKAVVIIDVHKENTLSLEEIHVVVQLNENPSVTYTSMVFQSLINAPYWAEVKAYSTKNPTKLALVTVIELKDLLGYSKNIDVSTLLIYKVDGSERYVPIERIKLSQLRSLSEERQVLSNGVLESHDILALMATSLKTDLAVRRIVGDERKEFHLHQLLCQYLDMTEITKELLVHRKTPYHSLNGLMVLIQETVGRRIFVTVFSRDAHQLMSLITSIQDLVPERIVITSSETVIKAKNDNYIDYNEEATVKETKKDWLAYGTSLMKQMNHIKRFYDTCFVKMNESKDENVRAKIGKEIDLYVNGVYDFDEFKIKLEDMMRESVENISKIVPKEAEPESMEWSWVSNG